MNKLTTEQIAEITARCKKAMKYEGGTVGEALITYHNSVLDVPALLAHIAQLEADREDEKEVEARISMVCMINDQLAAENAALREAERWITERLPNIEDEDKRGNVLALTGDEVCLVSSAMYTTFQHRYGGWKATPRPPEAKGE